MVKIKRENGILNGQISKIETADVEILHEYLKHLWDFLPNPTCDINGPLIIINIGKSFLDFFGYKKQEIIGESIKNVFAEEEEYKKFEKELLKKQTVYRQEINVVTKQGKIVPVAVFVSPKKENNLVVSYLVAFLDLSEIKEKEQQLQDKIKQLEFFQKLAEGRELKMVELKKEIEELKKKINNKNKSD